MEDFRVNTLENEINISIIEIAPTDLVLYKAKLFYQFLKNTLQKL